MMAVSAGDGALDLRLRGRGRTRGNVTAGVEFV